MLNESLTSIVTDALIEGIFVKGSTCGAVGGNTKLDKD